MVQARSVFLRICMHVCMCGWLSECVSVSFHATHFLRSLGLEEGMAQARMCMYIYICVWLFVCVRVECLHAIHHSPKTQPHTTQNTPSPHTHITPPPKNKTQNPTPPHTNPTTHKYSTPTTHIYIGAPRRGQIPPGIPGGQGDGHSAALPLRGGVVPRTEDPEAGGQGPFFVCFGLLCVAVVLCTLAVWAWHAACSTPFVLWRRCTASRRLFSFPV